MHYLNLKIAVIKTFTKEEFENFLICGNSDSINNFFSKKLYNEIRNKLSDINKESKYFWDFLYDYMMVIHYFKAIIPITR